MRRGGISFVIGSEKLLKNPTTTSTSSELERLYECYVLKVLMYSWWLMDGLLSVNRLMYSYSWLDVSGCHDPHQTTPSFVLVCLRTPLDRPYSEPKTLEESVSASAEECIKAMIIDLM